MKKIILAYCSDNADFATQLDRELSRAGVVFQHITNLPEAPSGQFAAAILESGDPVLLLVTDNYLKSRACMTEALPMLQTLNREYRVTPVIAEGWVSRDNSATYEVASTQIDRLADALRYMNHWQNIYLDLIARQQQLPPAERQMLDLEMQVVRDIASETGEFINTLRESGYLTAAQLAAQDYALFFKQFGLQDVHEKYQHLVRNSATERHSASVAPPPPGPLTLRPAETPAPLPAHETPEEEPKGQFAGMDALLQDFDEDPSEPTAPFPTDDAQALFEEPEAPPHSDAEVAQTIQDAWLWIEKGHTELGLQVFALAAEQHPDNELLRSEYQRALARYPHEAEPPVAPPAVETPGVSSLEEQQSEAKTYDHMGDTAAEKGDYLLAKYCWDRVMTINPAYPGIYRKLGILTSQHLAGYTETAIHYLELALDQNPDDLEVRRQLALLRNPALADELAATEKPLAEQETPALIFENEPPAAPETPVMEPAAPAIAVPESEKLPLAQQTALHLPTTVLITGATSGIGRATAVEFARHGYRLILTGRRADRLADLKTQLETGFGSAVLPLVFDVRDPDAVRDTLENLPESWRDIDILVNNAGLAKGLSPIHEGNLLHWETMIDTNLKGLLYVTRCIAPGMVRRRKGHIINVGSSAGKEVYPNGNVYCATKFAVDALSRAMRYDLYQHNIRVSQVSPGHVEETEFALNRFDGDVAKARIYDDFQPLKAGDIAEVIYFMATRPPHVNIQDILLFGTQQAGSMAIDRSGRS